MPFNTAEFHLVESGPIEPAIPELDGGVEVAQALLILVIEVAAPRHAIPRHVGIGGALVTTPHPVDDDHSKSDVLTADFSHVVAEELGLPPVVIREPILDEGCVVDLAFFPSRVCP